LNGILNGKPKRGNGSGNQFEDIGHERGVIIKDTRAICMAGYVQPRSLSIGVPGRAERQWRKLHKVEYPAPLSGLLASPSFSFLGCMGWGMWASEVLVPLGATLDTGGRSYYKGLESVLFVRHVSHSPPWQCTSTWTPIR